MQTSLSLELFIEHSRQGSYFTLPFAMPPNIERLDLSYSYDRFPESAVQVEAGAFTARPETNVIDLGLIAPDGSQVGASGADKRSIFVSEIDATPGYLPIPLTAGQWQILVGAYKVGPQGVKVIYELGFTHKALRLFKGDLHTHTLASDGVLTVTELAQRALRHGLDFLAITDHNQSCVSAALPRLPGLTLIPGVEWTHYQGHANFLGVDRPYDEPFVTHTFEEAQARFISARQRGAFIMINHPFEAGCEFKLDFKALPFDCLEVWNGPIRESNLRAIGLWQSLLEANLKVPICGGSDYHRDSPFIIPGGPTTCVYAQSASVSDLLTALRQGHAYITFAPFGPNLALTAGEAILGDTVAWEKVKQIDFSVDSLWATDVVRVVTDQGSQPVLEAPSAGKFDMSLPIAGPGFARVEVLRSFIPGLPKLPALISNPIYFR